MINENRNQPHTQIILKINRRLEINVSNPKTLKDSQPKTKEDKQDSLTATVKVTQDRPQTQTHLLKFVMESSTRTWKRLILLNQQNTVSDEQGRHQKRCITSKRST